MDGKAGSPVRATAQTFNLSRGSFAFGETSSTTPPIFPIVKSGRLENPNGFNLPPGTIKVRKGIPPSREFGDSLPGTACRAFFAPRHAFFLKRPCYNEAYFATKGGNSMDALDGFSREQLLELIDIYAKNWLALDGVWFQSIEQAEGMDAAMFHDERAWARFTAIEARRIKQFLGLDEHPGLEGLEKALALRFYGRLNQDECAYENGQLIYTMRKCRVQAARERKGMPFHPCKSVGVIEYAGFARAIDGRIQCRCLSCYPDVTDGRCACKWAFWLEDGAQ